MSDTFEFKGRKLDFFYSPLTRAAMDAKQKKAPAGDWKSILRKAPRVTAAELEWSGLFDWLDTLGKTQVAREDVVAYLEGTKIELTETILGRTPHKFNFLGSRPEWRAASYDDAEYIIDEAGDHDMPSYSISVGESTDPGEEFFKENAEDIYFDDLLQEAIDELDEDEDEDDIDRDSIMNEAIKKAEEAYYSDPDEYHATLSSSGDFTTYEGYYNAQDECYWFKELSDENLDEDEAIVKALEPFETAREAAIEAKLEELLKNDINNDGETREEFQAHLDEWDEKERETEAKNEEISKENEALGLTRIASFSKFTEPGGEKYKEFLIQVENLHLTGKNTPKDTNRSTDVIKEPFVQHGHFPDENIVVHARTTDRLDVHGNQILFSEEFQSDLGTVHREAVGDPETDRRRAEAQERRAVVRNQLTQLNTAYTASIVEFISSIPQDTKDSINENSQSLDRIIKDIILYCVGEKTPTHAAIEEGVLEDPNTLAGEIVEKLRKDGKIIEAHSEIKRLRVEENELTNELITLGSDKSLSPTIPDTPFKEELTYGLIIKRLLRHAAERGYAGFGFTPAYMQAERWNKAGQSVVDSLAWEGPHADANAAAVKSVVLSMSGGGHVRADVFDTGVVASTNETIDGQKLSSLIGPGLAKRVLSENEGAVSGQKITFSTSGYSVGYDQQAKRILDKLVKPYGGRVVIKNDLVDMMPTGYEMRSSLRKIDTDELIDVLISNGLVSHEHVRAQKLINSTKDGLHHGLTNDLNAHQLRDAFPELFKGKPIFYVEITPELRRGAMEPMSMFRTKNDNEDEYLSQVALNNLMKDLQGRLKRLNIKDVDLRVDAEFAHQGEVRFGEAGEIEVLIGQTLSPEATLNHEAIHILRRRGLFTDQEWAELEDQARDIWMDEFNIASRYPLASREIQLEEAIAEAYSKHTENKSSQSWVQKAFQKVRSFFSELGNVLSDNKVKSTSDIFTSIDAGRVGKRYNRDAEDVFGQAAFGRHAHQSYRVSTPEFQDWFDGSVVTTETGEPLALHHFGTFEEELDVPERGMHFGTLEAATDRAHGKIRDVVAMATTAYKNDEGIYHWEHHCGYTSELDGQPGFACAETAIEYGRAQSLKNDHSENEKIDDWGHITTVYLNIQNPMRTYDHGMDWDKAIDEAIRLGHDGIVYQNNYEDCGSKSWIAFYPDQVKSIHNQGTFDPRSDNIMHRRNADTYKAPTLTEAFKQWFGDSKITDDRGAPRVMYHGSSTEIEKFDHRSAQDRMGRSAAMGWGRGKFYFSDDEQVARSYSLMRGADAPIVIPTYLSVEKPIMQAEYEARYRIISGGYEIFQPYERGYDQMDRDQFILQLDEQLKGQGYDGIIGDIGQVAVFDTRQIKHVNNVGGFNPKDPRILHRAQQVETEPTSNPESYPAPKNN